MANRMKFPRGMMIGALAAMLAALAGGGARDARAQDVAVRDADGRRIDGANQASANERRLFDAVQTEVLAVIANRTALARVNALRAEQGLEALSADDYLVAEALGLDALVTDSAGLERLSEKAALPLPDYVDNSALAAFPAMRPQGEQASGAVWAAVYYLHSYAMAAREGWLANNDGLGMYRFSPKFVYPVLNGGRDAGASLEAAMLFLRAHGAATELDFDYADRAKPASTPEEYRAWDTDGAHWRQALEYRAGRVGRQLGVVSDAALKMLKQRLANGEILAAVAPGTFVWLPLADAGLPSAQAGHPAAVSVRARDGAEQALVIVGYDETAWVDANNNGQRDPGEVGAFKVALTQGANLSPAGCVDAGGFFWLLYDAAKADSEIYGGEVSGRELAFRDGATYWLEPSEERPLVLASVTVNRPADGFSLRLGTAPAGQEEPTARTEWSFPPVAGGAYGFDGLAFTGSETQKATFWFDYGELAEELTIAEDVATQVTQKRWFATLDGVEEQAAEGVTDFRLYLVADANSAAYDPDAKTALSRSTAGDVELGVSAEENYAQAAGVQMRWIDQTVSGWYQPTPAVTKNPTALFMMDWGTYLYDTTQHLDGGLSGFGPNQNLAVTDHACDPKTAVCKIYGHTDEDTYYPWGLAQNSQIEWCKRYEDGENKGKPVLDADGKRILDQGYTEENMDEFRAQDLNLHYPLLVPTPSSGYTFSGKLLPQFDFTWTTGGSFYLERFYRGSGDDKEYTNANDADVVPRTTYEPTLYYFYLNPTVIPTGKNPLIAIGHRWDRLPVGAVRVYPNGEDENDPQTTSYIFFPSGFVDEVTGERKGYRIWTTIYVEVLRPDGTAERVMVDPYQLNDNRTIESNDNGIQYCEVDNDWNDIPGTGTLNPDGTDSGARLMPMQERRRETTTGTPATDYLATYAFSFQRFDEVKAWPPPVMVSPFPRGVGGVAIDVPLSEDLIQMAADEGSYIKVWCFWGAGPENRPTGFVSTRIYHLKIAAVKAVFGQDQRGDSWALTNPVRWGVNGIPMEHQYSMLGRQVDNPNDVDRFYPVEGEYRIYAEKAPVLMWAPTEDNLGLKTEFRFKLGVPYIDNRTYRHLNYSAPRAPWRTAGGLTYYAAEDWRDYAPYGMTANTNSWYVEPTDEEKAVYEAEFGRLYNRMELSWQPPTVLMDHITMAGGSGGNPYYTNNPLVRDYNYTLISYAFLGGLIPSDPHVEWFVMVGNDSTATGNQKAGTERVAIPKFSVEQTTFTHYPVNLTLTSATPDVYFRYHVWGNSFRNEDDSFGNYADEYDDPFNAQAKPYVRIFDDGWIRYSNDSMNNYGSNFRLYQAPYPGGFWDVMPVGTYSPVGPTNYFYNEPYGPNREDLLRNRYHLGRAFYQSYTDQEDYQNYHHYVGNYRLHDPQNVYYGYRYGQAGKRYYRGLGNDKIDYSNTESEPLIVISDYERDGSGNIILDPDGNQIPIYTRYGSPIPHGPADKFGPSDTAPDNADPFITERGAIQLRRSAVVYARAYKKGTDTSWMQQNQSVYKHGGSGEIQIEYVGDKGTVHTNRWFLRGDHPYDPNNPSTDPNAPTRSPYDSGPPDVNYFRRYPFPRAVPLTDAEAAAAGLPNTGGLLTTYTPRMSPSETVYQKFMLRTDTPIFDPPGFDTPEEAALPENVFDYVPTVKIICQTMPENNKYEQLMVYYAFGQINIPAGHPKATTVPHNVHVYAEPGVYLADGSTSTSDGAVCLSARARLFNMTYNPDTGVYESTLNPIPAPYNDVLTPEGEAGLHPTRQLARSLANIKYYKMQCKDPTFVEEGAPREYVGSLTLHFNCTTPGAVIRYTFDGSEPNEDSMAYNPEYPPELTYSTTVKIRAFLSGVTPSNVVSRQYIFSQKQEVQVATPVIRPVTGNYTGFNDRTVTIAVDTASNDPRGVGYDSNDMPLENIDQIPADLLGTPNIRIYYSVDGTEPYPADLVGPGKAFEFIPIPVGAGSSKWYDPAVQGVNGIPGNEVVENGKTIGTITARAFDLNYLHMINQGYKAHGNNYANIPEWQAMFNKYDGVRANSEIRSETYTIKATLPYFTPLNVSARVGSYTTNVGTEAFIYKGQLQLQISSNMPASEIIILYTLNGTEPKINRNADGSFNSVGNANVYVYNGVLTFHKRQKIQAKVFSVDGTGVDSDVIAMEFRIQADSPAINAIDRDVNGNVNNDIDPDTLEPLFNGYVQVYTTQVGVELVAPVPGVVTQPDIEFMENMRNDGWRFPPYGVEGTTGTTFNPGLEVIYTEGVNMPPDPNNDNAIKINPASINNTPKGDNFAGGLLHGKDNKWKDYVSTFIRNTHFKARTLGIADMIESSDNDLETDGFQPIYRYLRVRAPSPEFFFRKDADPEPNVNEPDNRVRFNGGIFEEPLIDDLTVVIRNAVPLAPGFSKADFAGMRILYTLDGTVPVEGNASTLIYAEGTTNPGVSGNLNDAFKKNGTYVLTAIAVQPNMVNSKPAVVQITIAQPVTVAIPELYDSADKNNRVSLNDGGYFTPGNSINVFAESSVTPIGYDEGLGIFIYYTTDGSEPTSESTVYTNRIVISEPTTLRLIAICGDVKSEIREAVFFNSIPKPTFNPRPGVFSANSAGFNVSLAVQSPASKIFYTVDGSDPKIGGATTKEWDGTTIPVNRVNTVIKAIGVYVDGRGNEHSSEVAIAPYKFGLDGPIITPGSHKADPANDPILVTLTRTIEGSRIYYTVDGEAPDENSLLYTGPFNAWSGQVVRAIEVIDDGFGNLSYSNVSVADYFANIATPVFDPPGGIISVGSTTPVTLTCETLGARIFYTTNGSEPSPTSSSSIEYKENSPPISVTVPRTLKAKAFVQAGTGWEASAEATAVFAYTVGDVVFTPGSMMVSSGNSIDVTMTTNPALTGAVIYYTLDGTIPGPNNGYVYTGPIYVADNAFFRARAFATSISDGSLVASTKITSASYVRGFESPVIVPYDPDGLYCSEPVNVSIIPVEPIGVVYYTLNGLEPVKGRDYTYLYTGPFTVSATTTVTARTYFTLGATTYQSLLPSTADYIFASPAPAPAITPASGTYSTSSPPTVTITSTLAGATIYYTTDGTTPTSDSTVYTGPFTLPSTVGTYTVQAMVIVSGYAQSPVRTATYVISDGPAPITQVANPVFTYRSGRYTTPLNVLITCSTPGATIRYTVNGGEVTANSTSLATTPLQLSAVGTYTIRARGYLDGATPSEQVSTTYSVYVRP